MDLEDQDGFLAVCGFDTEDSISSAFDRFDCAQIGAELFDVGEAREIETRMAHSAGYEIRIVGEQRVPDLMVVRYHAADHTAGFAVALLGFTLKCEKLRLCGARRFTSVHVRNPLG